MVNREDFIPSWLSQMTVPHRLKNTDELLELAIDLSYQNVIHQTGGPFGAVIYSVQTYEIVSVGVNSVVRNAYCIYHAEMVGLLLAQMQCRTHRCNQETGAWGVASSSEPCGMCMNAIFMAGVTELVYGAMDSDVREIGFDEGLKPVDWVGAYHDRQISVDHKQHLRQKAVDVLKLYQQGDAPIYI